MCFDFPLNNHIAKKQTNKKTKTTAAAQLYPGRDTIEFDQGHVTKKQPITVLVSLIESLGI